MVLISIVIVMIACCLKRRKTTGGTLGRDRTRTGRETRVKTLSIGNDSIKEEKPETSQKEAIATNTDVNKGEIKKQDWDVGQMTNKEQDAERESVNDDDDDEIFQEYHEDANATVDTNARMGETETRRLTRELAI